MKIFWAWDDKYQEIEEFEWEEINVSNSGQILEEEGQVAFDIIENPEEIIIVSPIAWVDLEGIDISLKKDILTISWERRRPIELYLSGSILRISETFWGKFSRNIILPENLNLNWIKAILERNILIVRIPKLQFKEQSINIEKIDD